MPVSCVCQNPECEKIFFRVPSVVAKGRGKFCSTACAYPVHERICQNQACGKTFRIIASRLAKGGGQHCSLACRFPDEDVATRFWKRVTRCSHEAWCPFCCWGWNAAKTNGYGVMRVHEDGRAHNKLASRLMWEIINERPLILRREALHHCDNPPCVNPWHIYIGTQSHNMKDAYNRGRRHTAPPNLFGEDCYNARLKDEDIPMIFCLRADGWTHQKIADHFRVNRKTISHVLNRNTWRHISLTLPIAELL